MSREYFLVDYVPERLLRRRHRAVLFRDLSPDDDRQQAVSQESCEERPEEVAQRNEMQAAIEAAVEALPTKFREVFLLCEIEKMSYEEAATTLGIPVKTVSTRLFRARTRFSRMVEKHLKVTR